MQDFQLTTRTVWIYVDEVCQVFYPHQRRIHCLEHEPSFKFSELLLKIVSYYSFPIMYAALSSSFNLAVR